MKFAKMLALALSAVAMVTFAFLLHEWYSQSTPRGVFTYLCGAENIRQTEDGRWQFRTINIRYPGDRVGKENWGIKPFQNEAELIEAAVPLTEDDAVSISLRITEPTYEHEDEFYHYN